LKPGTTYEVPTTDSSIFDKVAQSGVPDYANVGGEKVLVTHGSSDGMWLVPDSVASNFFNNNPDFKQNGQVGESDGGAGIQATFEQGKNRLWLNAQGMQKYAGAKWLGCYDLISGKGFGTFGGSKDPIQVITQSSPEGQKTFLKANLNQQKNKNGLIIPIFGGNNLEEPFTQIHNFFNNCISN